MPGIVEEKEGRNKPEIEREREGREGGERQTTVLKNRRMFNSARSEICISLIINQHISGVLIMRNMIETCGRNSYRPIAVAF